MMLSKIINFITVDIWRISLKDFSRSKSFFIKQLRIIVLVLRGFDEDKCFLRASALTFFSLLSVVPVVAMAFGVAKGFGFQKVLEEQLLKQFPGQEEVMIKVIEFAQSLLENTEGGLVAGIGVVILFWAVIKVLGNIEDSFNNIWGIKKSRTWGRKLSDYLSLMLICPILLIVSGSITVLVVTQVEFILGKISFLSALNPIIFSVLNLLPYSVLWILFTFVYKFMPNIKVKFTSALLAGVLAGTIYEVVQWGYIAFQVGMSKNNAIYGGFAALPLFLVWLQLSWLIVLLGAELSYAYQNVDQYELEPDCQRVSVSFKRLLSLRITHLLVKKFSGENTLLTATSIAQLLKIPVRLVRQILFELIEGGVASEVKTDEPNESAYQPARDGEKLTIKYVIDALEHRGLEALPITQTRELDDLSKSLAEFDTIIEKSPANKSLKDI
jgi:membrane protein